MFLNLLLRSKLVKSECRMAVLIIKEQVNFHCEVLTVLWKERATNENYCCNHLWASEHHKPQEILLIGSEEKSSKENSFVLDHGLIHLTTGNSKKAREQCCSTLKNCPVFHAFLSIHWTFNTSACATWRSYFCISDKYSKIKFQEAGGWAS